MSDINHYFGYNTGSDILPENANRISPSQLSKFFDQTPTWYRENLLGESEFEGSTATEIGNCVHAAAQMYTETRAVDFSLINRYVESISNPEVDKAVVSEQYPYMAEELVNSYLSVTKFVEPKCEEFVHYEILPNIFVSGSIDMYSSNLGGTITDWKTMGSLDSARLPTKFPRAYWFQQMTYAWILRKLGRPIEYCKLVYVTRSNVGRVSEKTGKPLKSYPSQVHVLTEPVTDEAMALIDGVINLVAESIQTWNDKPELRYLLAQDYRLKQPTPRFVRKDL